MVVDEADRAGGNDLLQMQLDKLAAGQKLCRHRFRLEGKAQLSRSENGQQKDMTSGERIVYDMRNARSEVNSGEGKRVTTIIAPRSKTDAGTQRQGTSLSNSTKLQQ